MINRSIRIAVIGCGRVAKHYKKIVNSGVVSNFELIGFHDILPERSQYFADHFNTKSFDNFEEMLKDLLFSTNRVFSPEEVMDVVYLSYEKNWINKQYHESDYWFVNTT